MKSEPKRTSTQQGLGKVTVAEARRATRERLASSDDEAIEIPSSTTTPTNAIAPPRGAEYDESRPPPSDAASIVAAKKSTQPPLPRTDSVRPPAGDVNRAPPQSKSTASTASTGTKSGIPKSGGGSRRGTTGAATRSSNPPRGSAIPRNSVAPGRNSVAPGRNSVAPGRSSAAPSRNSAAPGRAGSAPPRGGNAPSRDARDGSAPPRRNASIPPRASAGGAPKTTLRSDEPRADSAPPSRDPDTGTRRRTLGNRASIAVDQVPTKRTDAVGLAGRAVPRIIKTKDEIAAAPIDHRAGFLLAHIDGSTNVQGLVDIAGMPEEDVHEILDRLRRLGILAIGPIR